MEIIFDTYLGDDVSTDNDKINHFKWCWSKNIDNFDKENIHFSHSNELYEYFLNFLMEVWYYANKSNLEHLNGNLREIWNHLFSPVKIKTRSEVDMFLEIYTLLTKSLTNN
jgi:hypothetical protein